MALFRLRSSPVCEWPRLPPAAVNSVWATYKELDGTQWLPPAELEQQQLRQLRLVLGHCAEQVPYYQRLFAEHGIVPAHIQSLADFRTIPLLSRQLYQQHFTDLTVRQLPLGTVKATAGFTSGTNGVPVQVQQTNDVIQWWFACMLRDLEWSSIDLRGSLASIRMFAKLREEFDRMARGCGVPTGTVSSTPSWKPGRWTAWTFTGGRSTSWPGSGRCSPITC